MIKVKAGNARNSRAIAKFSNVEIDYFGLKLIVHVLIRGSLVFLTYFDPVIVTEGNFTTVNGDEFPFSLDITLVYLVYTMVSTVSLGNLYNQDLVLVAPVEIIKNA